MEAKKYHSIRLSSSDLHNLVVALYTQAEQSDMTHDEIADIVVLRRRLESYKAREA